MLGNTIITPGSQRRGWGAGPYWHGPVADRRRFSYDSIFLPDTSYSTLPSPTVEQLARYKALIARRYSHWTMPRWPPCSASRPGRDPDRLGDFATNNSDHSAAARSSLRALLSKPGTIPYGSGRIVYSSSVYGVDFQRSNVAVQRSTQAAFQLFLGAYTQPEVEVAGPAAVVHEPGVTPYYYTDRNGTSWCIW